MAAASAQPRTLRLPAVLESLEPLRELALAAAQQAGLGADALGRVELALEEAVVNISRHAYDPPGSGELALTALALPGGGLRLVLEDQGRPFDPVAMSGDAPENGPEDEEPGLGPESGLAADLEANLEADLEHRLPGGMGLYLILSLAKASYRREGGSNQLTLDFQP